MEAQPAKTHCGLKIAFVDKFFFCNSPTSSTNSRHAHEELSEALQTLIRPQYLLRVRLIPSILTGPSLIPLRKLHWASRLQEQFKEHSDPPRQKRRVDKVFRRWEEFYTRARAIRNESSCGDLMKRAKEEPVDLFNASDTTLSAMDEIFEKIEKKRALQLS